MFKSFLRSSQSPWLLWRGGCLYCVRGDLLWRATNPPAPGLYFPGLFGMVKGSFDTFQGCQLRPGLSHWPQMASLALTPLLFLVSCLLLSLLASQSRLAEPYAPKGLPTMSHQSKPPPGEGNTAGHRGGFQFPLPQQPRRFGKWQWAYTSRRLLGRPCGWGRAWRGGTGFSSVSSSRTAPFPEVVLCLNKSQHSLWAAIRWPPLLGDRPPFLFH